MNVSGGMRRMRRGVVLREREVVRGRWKDRG